MAPDPIATRYAQALFDATKAEGHVSHTAEQLALIGRLLRDHADLRQFLLNPDVDPEAKVGLFERVLRGSWSDLVRAFVLMVISLGRTESLTEIVRAFQELVDADAGRIRVLVRSAHPLPETVLNRLRSRLAHREQKQVELTTEVVPQLLGGMQLFLGHRVIDGSVKRQVSELRERLMAVKVY